MSTIWVTRGQEQYRGGVITETEGEDISASVIVLAVGPEKPPPPSNAGGVPDHDVAGTTTDIRGNILHTRTVKKMIDINTLPGTDLYVWAWLTDVPEILPFRIDGPFDVK